jgi:hypothetical protein
MLTNMAAKTVQDLLAAQSATKLQAMEQAIDEQIADLQTQKQWIGKALIDKGVRPKPSSNPDSKPKKVKKGRSKSSRTGSSDVIRALLREQPSRVWMPREIIAAAQERGVTSTDQAIRVALRRMGEQGFLERGPGGEGWKLASSNGSQQESFSEAQTSGPGGMGG